MREYAETLREHARLAILRFLEDAPRYTSNVAMLAQLLPGVGITYSRDEIAAEARWLAERGLARVEEQQDFLVLTATGRGVEVAQGIVRSEGVARPRPRG